MTAGARHGVRPGAAGTPAAEASNRVLAGLQDLPGGGELIDAAAESQDDVALVGGAVRDLLLGRAPRELDVVLAEDPTALAAALAARLGDGATSKHHERFGTASVRWGEGRIDIARRRAESYRAPGALPDVRSGSVQEDLARRDFTVNAIALALAGANRGELRVVPDALEDLAAGRLRVLHEASFTDDPTRLLRLGRYHARLGFELESHTAELAAAALRDGALATVSGARIGAELRLALGEPEPIAALAGLAELGALAGVDERIEFAEPLARAALALAPDDASAPTLLLAILLAAIADQGGEGAGPAMRALLDRLEFPASEREQAVRTALSSPSLLERIAGRASPSAVNATLATVPLEAVALALARAEAGIGGPADADAVAAARRWLERLRHVRLAIGGEDLLAAGVPPGPQIGERLAAALALRLDGALEAGPEAELRAALEAPL